MICAGPDKETDAELLNAASAVGCYDSQRGGNAEPASLFGPSLDALFRSVRRQEVETEDVNSARPQAPGYALQVGLRADFSEQVPKAVQGAIGGVDGARKLEIGHVGAKYPGAKAATRQSPLQVIEGRLTEVESSHPEAPRSHFRHHAAAAARRLQEAAGRKGAILPPGRREEVRFLASLGLEGEVVVVRKVIPLCANDTS